MTRRIGSLLVLLAMGAGCKDDRGPLGPMDPNPPEPDPVCTQENVAFVREATLAVLGRRPLSQQEADSAAALIDEINELDESPGTAVGRRVWLEGVMSSPEFIDRWQEILLDALQVPRADAQALSDCYGTAKRKVDDAEVATFVRDHDAKATGMEDPFNFLDVMRSSLVLDDLSPVYRAHLFAMLSKPNFCGNVDPVEQELATRQEVGHVFDAAYTNRDQVCLSCHNSESSVTYRPLAADNRHFAIAANLEKAVFGASEGVTEAVPHAVFRTSGMLSGGFGETLDCGDGNFAYCGGDSGKDVICDNGTKVKCPSGRAPFCDEDTLMVACPDSGGTINPWGADQGCGTFNPTVQDDPAEIDARLATVKGKRATVFDLEQALKRGIDVLARDGLVVSKKGDVEDPEAALAYLVALNIVDRVWKEVIGSSLTIATRFPRTQVAHDRLEKLTNHFVAEHFSLKTLLVDIVQTEEFNALAPADGCGPAYALDPVFDPWVRDEPELERRRNSAADGVHPLSPRTLMSATYAALGWPVPEGSRFPGFGGGGDDDMGMEDDGEEPADPEPPVDAEDDGDDVPDAGTDQPDAGGACGTKCDEVSEKCDATGECCEQLEAACLDTCWNLATCEEAETTCTESGDCCSMKQWLCDPCLNATCDEAKTLCEEDMECCDWVEPLCGGGGGGGGGTDELGFQRSIGVFLSISQKGFRGLDLSARLSWEERFGSCAKPEGVAVDAIDQLVESAILEKASVQDAVLALKDRLIGEPRFDPGEAALVRELVGAQFGAQLKRGDEAGLRALCGALLSSPEHLLGGLSPRGGELPRLGPTKGQACKKLAALSFAPYEIDCAGGKLHVTRGKGH